MLALKANHRVLHADVQSFFDDGPTFQGWLRRQGSQAKSVEKDHARIEERTAWALLPVEALFGGLRGLSAWSGLRSLCAVESRRESTTNGATSTERRYFLSSLAPDAARLLVLVRGHWAIENKLHWALDVHFDEDRCRVRKEHAPLNLATLRRVALSLAKRDAQTPTSVRLRLKRAGWDDTYLFSLLNI